jgi:hypothetical protein
MLPLPEKSFGKAPFLPVVAWYRSLQAQPDTIAQLAGYSAAIRPLRSNRFVCTADSRPFPDSFPTRSALSTA